MHIATKDELDGTYEMTHCVHFPGAQLPRWRRWFHHGIEVFCVGHVTIEFLIPWAMKLV